MARRCSPPSRTLRSPCTAPSTWSGGSSSSTCAPATSCNQTSDLKLKFVAHVGEVAIQKIKRRRKLVGIDVIFVHRLLKNPVEVSEYVLFSEELYRAADCLGPTTRCMRSRRISRESDLCARTSWMSMTSPGAKRRFRIPPRSGASAKPSACSAGGSDTSSARVVPLRLTDTSAAPAGSKLAQAASLRADRRSASALSLAVTTSSPAAKLAGYPVTAVRYVFRCRTLARMLVSADARTVAVRRWSRSRAISPKESPGPSIADDASVVDHLSPTGLDDVEALAALALLEHRLPG